MPDWPVIRTPREVLGTLTAAEYAKAHRKQIEALRRRRLLIAEHAADDGAPPIVSGGTWLVVCTCRGGAVASRDWDEARCFDCGAVYRHLAWPDDADAIEAALLARPQASRHWWGDADSQARLASVFGEGLVQMFGSTTGETVDDLSADNVVRGIPASEGDPPPSMGDRELAEAHLATKTQARGSTRAV